MPRIEDSNERPFTNQGNATHTKNSHLQMLRAAVAQCARVAPRNNNFGGITNRHLLYHPRPGRRKQLDISTLGQRGAPRGPLRVKRSWKPIHRYRTQAPCQYRRWRPGKETLGQRRAPGGPTMAKRLGQATHHSHTASRPQERRWRLNRLTLSQRRAPHGPTTWEADTSRYDTRVLQGRGWQLDRTAGYRAVGSRAVGRSTVRVIGRRMFGLSAARALRRLGAAALGHSGVRVFLVVCATKHSGNRRVP
jgi:hypothetical protein